MSHEVHVEKRLRAFGLFPASTKDFMLRNTGFIRRVPHLHLPRLFRVPSKVPYRFRVLCVYCHPVPTACRVGFGWFQAPFSLPVIDSAFFLIVYI